MDKPKETELRSRLEDLKVEHHDLDDVITSIQHQDRSDVLQVTRLKKRKLVLKDEITKIEDVLLPDIIA